MTELKRDKCVMRCLFPTCFAFASSGNIITTIIIIITTIIILIISSSVNNNGKSINYNINSIFAYLYTCLISNLKRSSQDKTFKVLANITRPFHSVPHLYVLTSLSLLLLS